MDSIATTDRIKEKIWPSRQISKYYKLSLFDGVKHSWIVFIDQSFLTAQSLNLLVFSSSRLIFVSKESLKSRIHQTSRKNSLLELRESILENVEWKALIRRSIRSFRVKIWVRLCVFLLFFRHLSLNLNIKAYIRLIFRNFIKFSLFAIDFSNLDFAPWFLCEY